MRHQLIEFIESEGIRGISAIVNASSAHMIRNELQYCKSDRPPAASFSVSVAFPKDRATHGSKECEVRAGEVFEKHVRRNRQRGNSLEDGKVNTVKQGGGYSRTGMNEKVEQPQPPHARTEEQLGGCSSQHSGAVPRTALLGHYPRLSADKREILLRPRLGSTAFCLLIASSRRKVTLEGHRLELLMHLAIIRDCVHDSRCSKAC